MLSENTNYKKTMINLYKTISLLFCFLIICNSAFAQTKNDWENPEIFQINQVSPHTNLMPFNSLKEALSLDKKSSPNFFSLNGVWKFNLSDNLENAPADFYQDSFNRTKLG